MVSIPALWLPILVSAILVFAASSVIHMMLPYHRSDYKKLPDESSVLDGLRGANIPPGDYFFPAISSPKDMATPEMQEKYKKGPIGFATFRPVGPPAMGPSLLLWFGYSLLMGVAVAYLTGRVLGPGAPYLAVFRFAGTGAFLGYAGAQPVASIWMGRSWSTTIKNVIDGLVYALVTAGAFGWLWPE